MTRGLSQSAARHFAPIRQDRSDRFRGAEERCP